MNISDLTAILAATLADMEKLNISVEISHPDELYWLTPINEKFDMSNRPFTYEVGNLREEFDSVMTRLRNGDIVYPDSLLLLSTMARLAYEVSGQID
jgi:hypothetical protein